MHRHFLSGLSFRLVRRIRTGAVTCHRSGPEWNANMIQATSTATTSGLIQSRWAAIVHYPS
jgi:hypothetical protein